MRRKPTPIKFSRLRNCVFAPAAIILLFGETMAAIRTPPGVPLVPVGELRPHPDNPRTHTDEQVAKLAEAIRTVGWTNPIIADDDGTILAGHGRLRAALRLGMETVPVLTLSDVAPAVRSAILLGDNRLAEDAGWDRDILAMIVADLDAVGFDLGVAGFEAVEIDDLLGRSASGGDDGGPAPAGTSEGASATGTGSLAGRFGVPPFSVLNAREGWWQDRKRGWLALGIRSEIGRGGNLLRLSDTLIEPDPEKRAAMQASRVPERAGRRAKGRVA